MKWVMKFKKKKKEIMTSNKFTSIIKSVFKKCITSHFLCDKILVFGLVIRRKKKIKTNAKNMHIKNAVGPEEKSSILVSSQCRSIGPNPIISQRQKKNCALSVSRCCMQACCKV